ncbi:MAG: RidA family protein [Oscillospiraceae bacterium]|nr:RidA family protein [Oscillospiraceae bacterium]
MNIINTTEAPKPVGPYSQAVKAEGFLFCSGQIAINPETGEFNDKDVSVQTEQVCKNIGAVLRASGLSFDDVVKTTCFLINGEDFAPFNSVYAKYFTSSPARSCVFVKGLPKNALVEIETVAICRKSEEEVINNAQREK